MYNGFWKAWGSKTCEEEFKKFCKVKGIEIGAISVDSERRENGEGREIS